MCIKEFVCASYIETAKFYLEENNKLRDRITELEAAAPLPPKPVFPLHVRSAAWVEGVLNIMVREGGCELDIEPLVDEEYRVMSEADFKVAIKYLGLHLMKYQDIYFDCDEFAEIAPALFVLEFGANSMAQVIDYSSRHAYNLGIVLNGAGIYEPQNASFNLDVAGRNKNLYGMMKTKPNGYIQL